MCLIPYLHIIHPTGGQCRAPVHAKGCGSHAPRETRRWIRREARNPPRLSICVRQEVHRREVGACCPGPGRQGGDSSAGPV